MIFALNHTLMVQEKLRRGKLEVSYTTDDLIKQYNCGDIEAITVDQDSVQVNLYRNMVLIFSDYKIIYLRVNYLGQFNNTMHLIMNR